MAKKTEAQRIREVLTEAPDLTNQEVIELLEVEGVEVSSSQVSRQRSNVAEPEPEPTAEDSGSEPAPEPEVFIGYDASKLRKQLGCSEEAIAKVVAVQKAEGLRSATDALRHILEQA